MGSNPIRATDRMFTRGLWSGASAPVGLEHRISPLAVVMTDHGALLAPRHPARLLDSVRDWE